MCTDTPEEKAEITNVPYHELVYKLLYLAVVGREKVGRPGLNPGPPHKDPGCHLGYMKSGPERHRDE